MQDIINEAYANGSFIIAAAGNGSTCGGADQLVYPASLDHVFSVTSIGANSFSGCTGFTGSLTIPDSVTVIDTYAFNNTDFTGNLTMF